MTYPSSLQPSPESYPAWTSLDEETREWVREVAATIKVYLNRSFKAENDAKAYLAEVNLGNEELGGLWCILESYEKAALKRHNH